MKIKMWKVVTDGGDGEHHSHNYPSLEAMVADLGLTDVQVYDNGDGGAFDQYDYHVDISTEIFDTTGYEIVEA